MAPALWSAPQRIWVAPSPAAFSVAYVSSPVDMAGAELQAPLATRQAPAARGDLIGGVSNQARVRPAAFSVATRQPPSLANAARRRSLTIVGDAGVLPKKLHVCTVDLSSKELRKINICLHTLEVGANDGSAQELENALKNEVHAENLTEIWPF